MNETFFPQNKNAHRRHWKRTGKTACCLLLALALLLSGCSSPSSKEENAPAAETPTVGDAPNASENPAAGDAQDAAENPAADDAQDAAENPAAGDAQDAAENPADDDAQDAADDVQESSGQTSADAEGDLDFNQPLDLKVPEPAAGEAPRILFVGNSHTYTNDLPVLFSEVAAAMGHPSDVQEVTEGMYTLTQFADGADELGAIVNQKLTEETWDFVIIQENTNDAFSFPEENMLPAAASLNEKIQAAGGQTALLMPWTPKEGAGIIGPEYVQSVLAKNTIDVSKELDSLLIPGGVGFMRCLEQYPQIELWDEDGMHPSLEGSYLAACIAYAVIFQESPAGCTYTAGLEGETPAILQELAAGFLAG